jgi:hypothetical protein
MQCSVLNARVARLYAFVLSGGIKYFLLASQNEPASMQAGERVGQISATYRSNAMDAIAPRTEIQILQVTCSHCGHVREFERDEALSVQHLEDMSVWRCIECSARGGSVFAFFSRTAAFERVLERLPTRLRLVEPLASPPGTETKMLRSKG